MIEGVTLFEKQGKGGKISWIKVIEYMNSSRSQHQCRSRWSQKFKPNIVTKVIKVPWSKAEVFI